MKYAIGIDIGGTKISTVLGDEHGKIFSRHEVPTRFDKEIPACLEDVTLGIKTLLSKTKIPLKKIVGIGVCAPGAVNPKKKFLPRSPNLSGWAKVPIKTILKKKFNRSVYVANDANAAALGEYHFGIARGKKNLVYVTVSTGIGAGIILNGKLIDGAGFVAGEIGHMNVVLNGDLCGCGKKGCLEVYASGTAIGKTYQKLSGKKIINGAREVGELFKDGDCFAREAYKLAANYLGIGLANLMNILNPDVIVIGGGVLKSAPKFYWSEVIKNANELAWPEAAVTTKIVKSNLIGKSGELGALALAFLEFAPSRT